MIMHKHWNGLGRLDVTTMFATLKFRNSVYIFYYKFDVILTVHLR